MKKTAMLIMMVTIVSKVFGFLRDLVLSYYYGASNVSDAYLIAMTIPGVVFALIGVGIINGYIPMYTKIESEQGVKKADEYTSNFTNIVFLFTFIIFVLGMIFTKPLVIMFAKGFTGETLDLAVSFSRITLAGIFFTGLTYIFVGYLQLKNTFVIPAMIGFPLNIITILAIALSSKGNVKLLVIGSFLATMSQFLFLLPSVIKKGYRHKLVVDFKDDNMRRMLIIVMPIIIGSSVNQINTLVDRTLASEIAVGGISAINYAFKLNGFVQGLFVLSIVTAMYPMISKMAANKDIEGLKKSVSEAISIIIIVVVPATAIAMIFSSEIIDLLFKRGNFDTEAAKMTASALFYFAIGMLGFGLRELLTRVFYSMQDTRTPVINGAIAMFMNIILNIILSRFMGIGGLALATSISATVCTLMLGYSLVKKIGSIGMKEIVTTTIKVLIASTVMGIVTIVLFNRIQDYMSSLLILVTVSFIGFIVYMTMAKVLKVEEVDKGMALVMSKFGKRG